MSNPGEQTAPMDASRCFVIQPFDRGPFDQRYDETIAPAVVAAGLKPYRVDRDLKASDLLQAIEEGIRNATLSLADITQPNPNVWFELGYALACGKEVVLVADESRRDRIPFDIFHRPITFYKTTSAGDFSKLGTEVTARLKAVMEKLSTVVNIADADIKETEGLSSAEFAALVLFGSQHLDAGTGMSAHDIKQSMGRAGYTAIAVSLAVRGLTQKKLVDSVENPGSYGTTYTTYFATESGMDWLARNQDKLLLQKQTARTDPPPDQLDDIPF